MVCLSVSPSNCVGLWVRDDRVDKSENTHFHPSPIGNSRVSGPVSNVSIFGCTASTNLSATRGRSAVPVPCLNLLCLEPRGWDLGLQTRIWALRLGFGPQDWDLRGGHRRRRRRRRRRKIPTCVKAYVIDPFGAAAQKGTDQPTNQRTDQPTDQPTDGPT